MHRFTRLAVLFLIITWSVDGAADWTRKTFWVSKEKARQVGSKGGFKLIRKGKTLIVRSFVPRRRGLRKGFEVKQLFTKLSTRQDGHVHGLYNKQIALDTLLEQIDRRFIKKVSPAKISEIALAAIERGTQNDALAVYDAAISGIVEGLGEPHTTLFSSSDAKLINQLFSKHGGKEVAPEIDRRWSVTTSLERGGIGVVRLPAFRSNTDSLVAENIEALAKETPLRGLVLDLRGNCGGGVVPTKDLLSRFVGRRTLFKRKNAHNMRWELGLFEHQTLAKLPVVILVDKNTASAAEIFAGVMKNLKRAVVVGERTYGKGTEQHFKELADGSMLRLTARKLLLPTSRRLWARYVPYDGKGIVPNVTVEQARAVVGSQSADPAADYALLLLRGSSPKRH